MRWWARVRTAGAEALEALAPRRALARAEADARLAEERLRAALEVLPEGIVFLDSEGRYVLWNAKYAEMYHRSSDLFAPGARLADTLRIGVERGDYPDALGREDAWLAHRLSLLENPGQRHEQRLADGRWLMIEERRTSDGGLIGLRVDITAMKAQAAALSEALAQAEAASRAKSEFLANMSHELRTPLNGVLGFAQVLERTDLDADQRTLLEAVIGSATALNGLLADILDYNALEAGRVEIASEPFDLAALVARTAEAFRAEAEAKGLALRLSVADDAGAGVLGDEGRIGQIISNLVSNAVKFTARGEVVVEVAADPAGLFRISVTDTGVGLDESQAARLFDRFEQGDASPTRAQGGVGLGLAICSQLTTLMGGEIAVRSRLGEGARFTVSLPLPAAPAPAPPAAPLRVLLADDNAANRRVVEMMLTSVDAEVVSVGDGKAAIDALEQGAFDVVLMDLQMPVLDGLSAIRLIREAEARAGATRLPIIVISANSSAADLAASSAAGADAHLSKPIRAEALLRALAAPG